MLAALAPLPVAQRFTMLQWAYPQWVRSVILKDSPYQCLWSKSWRRTVINQSKTQSYRSSLTDIPDKRPTLQVTAVGKADLLAGKPWIHKQAIYQLERLRQASPCLVNVETLDHTSLGVAMFNEGSLVAGRLLSTDRQQRIDRQFFIDKLEESLRLRDSIFPEPFYRVIHAEADQLPGVIIDRYGQMVSFQIHSAVMDTFASALISAIEAVLDSKVIIMRNDSATRLLERLPRRREVCKGVYKFPTELRENGITFFVDLLNGQKTGWFYDQRDNRAMLTAYCKGKSVLDLYSYVGGFGIQAAAYGASNVVCVDTSLAAIKLGRLSAAANLVDDRVLFVRADVERFIDLHSAFYARIATGDEQSNEQFSGVSKEHETIKVAIRSMPHTFDVVVLDPPALAKEKANVNAALKIYTRLTSKAASLISKNGLLFVSSCSSALTLDALLFAILRGLCEAGRAAKVLQETGASMDHPIHLALPESRYLRGILLSIQ